MSTSDETLLDPVATARASAFTDPFEGASHRLSAAIVQSLGSGVSAIAARGFSPRELDAHLSSGAVRVMARDGFHDAFLLVTDRASSAAVQWRVGKNVSLDVLASHAGGDEVSQEHMEWAHTDDLLEPASSNFRAGLAFASPRADIRLEAGMRGELDGILGARIGGVFGEGLASTTYYHSASMDMPVANGWRATWRYGVGVTTTPADGSSGFLAGVDDLVSTQFAVGAYRRGVFARGDAVTFSASQPLRVESGALQLVVADGYDFKLDALLFNERSVAFHAGPREIDFEAGYSFAGAFGSRLEANLIHQINVGPDGRPSTAGVFRAAWEF